MESWKNNLKPGKVLEKSWKIVSEKGYEPCDLVENETVVNVNESHIKENVVNVVINETNLVNDIESNDSLASGSMECSSSPCISSFSSPSGPPDSLDQLRAAGRKRSKHAIVPSVAVAAASIMKRSKAVPGAGVQKKKSK